MPNSQFLDMAREISSAVLLVLAAVFAIAHARPIIEPLVIRGRVFCDTCLAGFETSKTTYIPGAVVEVICKDRDTMELRYSRRGTTDSTGTYQITVEEDHGDEMCEVYPVSSPMGECSKVSMVRQASQIPLTVNNGISSFVRNANSVAFVREEAIAGCAEVLAQYQEEDD